VCVHTGGRAEGVVDAESSASRTPSLAFSPATSHKILAELKDHQMQTSSGVLAEVVMGNLFAPAQVEEPQVEEPC
jgi:hypothetical protein